MSTSPDPITPEYVREQVARGKRYFLAVLTLGPADRSDRDKLAAIQMQHLIQNLTLRRDGKLVVHGPALVDPATHFRAIGIFAADSAEDVRAILDADPMIVAGYLRAEIYPWMGFPGDCLP